MLPGFEKQSTGRTSTEMRMVSGGLEFNPFIQISLFLDES